MDAPHLRANANKSLKERLVVLFAAAGLPALQDGELGQVRKEAATAVYCECRGKARHLLLFCSVKRLLARHHLVDSSFS